MQFGYFTLSDNRYPNNPRSAEEFLRDIYAEALLAEKVGLNSAWIGEHHFNLLGVNASPLAMLAQLAGATTKLRLAPAVTLLPVHHPLHVAEEWATLDLLSGGRVELGMGEAAGPAELHPFGIRVRDKRERWEEAVKAIVPMFTRDSWEFHGQYYDFPARNVIPKPLQKPHPPLWVACSQLETLAKCGEWGMGALGFQFVSADAAHAWVHAYYNAFVKRQKKLADYRSNPNIALVSFFMCAKTDEEARARADGDTFFQFGTSSTASNWMLRVGT